MKRLERLQNLASEYGFVVLDISDRYPYKERKGKTWGLIDKRNGILAASSSTLYELEMYLKQRINA